MIATLAAERAQRPVLVIDDAQLLDAEVYALIARILPAGRDALTTIIASRSRSTVPLARLRSLGRLLEIGVEDLRFSPAEAARFVSMNGSGSVNPEAVQVLVEETAGWIGGIVMAGTMHRREWTYSGAGPRPVSGFRREFEAYFEEEVMALQPPRVRNFLVDSAVLDELTPAACAAVTGCENGRRLLEDVEEAGLFIEASGSERASYRYHPLFREMVLRRLYDRDYARAAELHRRASRHFAEAGDVLRAFDHAGRSGDQEFLADQLERLAETAIYAGFLYRLHELAATLPPTLLKGRPNLLLAMAWRKTRTLAFSTAETLMNMAAAAVQEAWNAEAISELEHAHLLRTIEHRRIMLMAARDEMAELEPRAEKLLAELGDSHPYLIPPRGFSDSRG
jgi:LuxR family maltose regulon positive regulatory protein